MKLLNVIAALTIRAAWCASGLYSRTCRSPILLLRPDSPPDDAEEARQRLFKLLLIFGFSGERFKCFCTRLYSFGTSPS